jgi:hypothetical protein
MYVSTSTVTKSVHVSIGMTGCKILKTRVIHTQYLDGQVWILVILALNTVLYILYWPPQHLNAADVYSLQLYELVL